MNEFFRIKNKSYVTIANAFLKDKELSNKAKGVLSMILALPDDWDFSIVGMVAITKDGETSLRAAINELKEHNYCFMQPVKIAGKYVRWKYYFSGEVITEEQLNDILHMEKPLVENPKVENQAQYNNIINKESNKEKSKSNDLPKKGGKSPRFVKPTIEQIDDYIKEKGYDFDAEEFFYFYESKGWVVGKNSPMKDWKSACTTWDKKRNSKNREKEEKEESAAVEIPADDIEPWERTQKWMREKTPTFTDRVSYRDFAEMRGYAMFNAKVFADILVGIYESGYEGDIVGEFKRRYDEV